MYIYAGVAAIFIIAAVSIAYRLLRHQTISDQNFAPVVELAKTNSTHKIRFRAATFLAKKPVLNPKKTILLEPPTIPFVTQTISSEKPVSAAETAQRSPYATGPVTPLEPLPPETSNLEDEKTVEPIYKNKTGPYAARLVNNSRITLPDENYDLPITFRSTHPDAVPIAQAGESAEQIKVTDDTGRIKLEKNEIITFGISAD